MALPLALLLLVALGLIAGAASTMSNTDLRISSAFASSNHALDVADGAVEHGVAELTARSLAGQDPDNVVILSDTLDGYAYSVTAFSKREHSGEGGRDFNNDGDKTDVVRYDRSFGYASATASGAAGDQGYPVKILVTEAGNGRSSARVEVEIARDRLKSDLGNPLMLNAGTTLTGSMDVDGRLHDRNGNLIPSGTLIPPYGNTAESRAAAKQDCNYWKAGVKIPAEGTLDFSGSISSVGHVAFDHGAQGDENFDDEDSLATFPFTPEEVLGLEPGALDAYKKDASAVPDFRNLSGVNYVVSGSIPSQIEGSGILIVHNPNYDARTYDCEHFPTTCRTGDSLDPANEPMELRINANGTFKGIIITDQLIRLNGNFTILGGLASLSTESVDIAGNGNTSVKWSCQTVTDALDRASGYSVDLWWKQSLEG